VQEVLIDGRELGRQLLVQEFDYPIVSAHLLSLARGVRQTGAKRVSGNRGVTRR
jgi:hypothetical protein